MKINSDRAKENYRTESVMCVTLGWSHIIKYWKVTAC